MARPGSLIIFDSKLLFHFNPLEVIHSSLLEEAWSHQTLFAPPEGRRVFITKIVLSGTFSFCFLQICHEMDVTRQKKMNTLCETAFRHRCRPLFVLIRCLTPFHFHLRGKIFIQHKSHVFNGTAAKPLQREEPKALSFYGAACFKKSVLSWGDDRELGTS